jgi:hypothetical protein
MWEISTRMWETSMEGRTKDEIEDVRKEESNRWNKATEETSKKGSNRVMIQSNRIMKQSNRGRKQSS